MARKRRGVRAFKDDTDGGTAIIVALIFPVLIGFGALAVDVSNLYSVESRLQVAADSAAVAGAMKLQTGSSPEIPACNTALNYAATNLRAGERADNAKYAAVQLGKWNPSQIGTPEGPFTCFYRCIFADNATDLRNPCPDVDPKQTKSPPGAPDAVRVTTQRTTDGGNSVPLSLASIFGDSAADVRVAATAAATGRTCSNDWGIIAETDIDFDKAATINAGVCIYARDSVDFKKNATVAQGSAVGSRDRLNIEFRKNAQVNDDQLFAADQSPVRVADIDKTIQDIENNVFPDHITRKEVINNGQLPDTLDSGTAYIVDGNLRVDKNTSIRKDDIMILVKGDARFKKNVSIERSTSDCANEWRPNDILATGKVSFDKGADLSFTRIVSKGEIHFKSSGNDAIDLFSVPMQSGGRIRIKKEADIDACDADEKNAALASGEVNLVQ